jgi:hypothetical protein
MHGGVVVVHRIAERQFGALASSGDRLISTNRSAEQALTG